MPKRYTFVLNFGYVESQELSYMPWTSHQTYSTTPDALVDLAKFLLEQYLEGNPYQRKKCCNAVLEKDKEAKFCSKCGKELTKPPFDAEKFKEYLRQIAHTDNDSIGDYLEEMHSKTLRWEPGLLENTPNQRFVYQAEWVLSAAAGHPRDPAKTFEVICKERTKSKRDSFTYYY